MALFDRALSKAFVDALWREADKNTWWRDVLNDAGLVVAPRGRSLNVYWRGQAIFTASCPNGELRVTTHEKYLINPALEGQVPLTADGAFDTKSLEQHVVERRYKNKTTLSKLKTVAGLYAGDEKLGCHEIAVRNPSVLDVEIAFPGKYTFPQGHTATARRVDFAAVEPDGPDARLVFWEAKTYANKDLWPLADGSAPVCQQIEDYRTLLAAQRPAVEASYASVAANLVEFKRMGWTRRLSPLIDAVGTGEAKLHLGSEPQVNLVVFGYDDDQKKGMRWKTQLSKLKERIGKVRPVGNATQISL
ncbi:hypothetical protein [Methylobacterium sp. WL7]|uniref:hypothetical protein n=1 Tax=Methylobacterium sp. WL7 TaxID=2603900 RepID=UPI0011C94AB6|nr:hypothetical protein [Methylobacterium sp. WL7]TXN41743.1 hypothetical protein FV233_24785 [Methylobacterium sp. WL7]